MRVHHPGSERGSATVELVVAVPVLLFMIMLVIQFGLVWHATHVAQAAAQEGVRAARLADGTADAGQARAQTFVHEAAPTLLHGVTVTASRNLRTARVEVRGTVQAVVPGFGLTVDASLESPIETFRAPPP